MCDRPRLDCTISVQKFKLRSVNSVILGRNIFWHHNCNKVLVEAWVLEINIEFSHLDQRLAGRACVSRPRSDRDGDFKCLANWGQVFVIVDVKGVVCACDHCFSII